MPARRSNQGRLWVFVVLVVALMGTLLARLAMVQIGEHDDYVSAAKRVNTRVIVRPAVRGRILDAARKPLADNTS
ncbi:MAG: penicillin-binding protein, partial [Actinobacteria bacterium]|nr:penicillin-binding protein [Actinomycetota bacterium]